MRTYCILTLISLCAMTMYSQKLDLEKASPFTAVRWENDQPIVQFENEWYHFEKLDQFSKKELLDYCKQQFGNKWQKRFSEDLVEVLQGLNYQPNIEVTLQLSKEGVLKIGTGTFTFNNRQRTLQYNRNAENPAPAQKITCIQALEDLKQFEQIIESRSSYAQLSTFDYTSAIKEVAASIESKNNDVDSNELTHKLSKIMSEIGDRHASVKNEAFHKKNHTTYNLRLPFGVATVNGKMIGVKQNTRDKDYTYYDNVYPYIKSIDGIAIETLVNTYNYRDKKAPTPAKLSRAAGAIQNYGALLFKNNVTCPENVTVVFTNGTTHTTKVVPLTTDTNAYISKLVEDNHANSIKIEKGNFEGVSKLLANNIGYISIPEMYHYDEVKGLEAYINNTLQRFSNTKALLIDIRNNPGGGRELLQTFARYIVPPEQSPWIANVAYLRTEATILEEEASMNARYLYPYASEKFTPNDRQAIDQFNKTFKLQKTFDASKFSKPFYMVLQHGKKPYTQPVYILVNEKSFSAASVFTSAFKGLPNVTIVGETTDGSSGNSREFYLKHSNIRVKVATMLSFQRNGKTLDGNGTLPDIHIPAHEEQVLKGVDSQLLQLLELL